MGKGKRLRAKRQETAMQLDAFSNPKEKYSSSLMGFCLPDTPDNREAIREITGKDPALFVNEDGMLDSFYEKNTHKQAVKPL